ncbi:MAG TPA: hypothetical protein VKG79_00075 [Bryobacteraceae bacterium]|nr:hypothetical protein [Bryobacteraceae bacterium]
MPTHQTAFQFFQRRALGGHAHVAVVFQDSTGHVAGDCHQRGIGRAGFSHFGDGLVALVKEAQTADWGGGAFPG